MKRLLFLFFSISLLLFSCVPVEVKSIDSDMFTSDLFEGVYLADEVYFPQDTIVLSKFHLSDSSEEKKLLVHFRNDSLFLSNYNFGPWYGKWFCIFRSAKATFGKNRLILHTHYTPSRNLICDNEDPWRRMEFRVSDSTAHLLTLIKTSDTTSCIFPKVYERSIREGFLSRQGEEVRSDIQLR